MVRQMTPPQVEVLLVFYPRGNPQMISSAIACSDTGVAAINQLEAYERSKAAASAYIVTKPNMPAFAPQS